MTTDGVHVSPVAVAYDRWSDTYDTNHNTTRDLDALVLRSSGLTLHDKRVVELGCGTGKNTVWLAQHAASVIAFDFSTGMLSKARERVQAPQVRFMVQDVREPWNLETNAVDVVVGNLVLEHVEHLDHVSVEAARVLAPHGVLYCCELHPFRQWRGGQAQFHDAASGDVVRVDAYVHTTSEYISAGLRAGLVLTQIGEHVEHDAPTDALPRLLSLQFQRP